MVSFLMNCTILFAQDDKASCKFRIKYNYSCFDEKTGSDECRLVSILILNEYGTTIVGVGYSDSINTNSISLYPLDSSKTTWIGEIEYDVFGNIITQHIPGFTDSTHQKRIYYRYAASPECGSKSPRVVCIKDDCGNVIDEVTYYEHFPNKVQSHYKYKYVYE